MSMNTVEIIAKSSKAAQYFCILYEKPFLEVHFNDNIWHNFGSATDFWSMDIES